MRRRSGAEFDVLWERERGFVRASTLWVKVSRPSRNESSDHRSWQKEAVNRDVACRFAGRTGRTGGI